MIAVIPSGPNISKNNLSIYINKSNDQSSILDAKASFHIISK